MFAPPEKGRESEPGIISETRRARVFVVPSASFASVERSRASAFAACTVSFSSVKMEQGLISIVVLRQWNGVVRSHGAEGVKECQAWTRTPAAKAHVSPERRMHPHLLIAARCTQSAVIVLARVTALTISCSRRSHAARKTLRVLLANKAFACKSDH